ncbi:MAG: ABC transporter permease [Clostridiales Family XIII bacterium]|jgi:putative ABC transport system permease protein|nr:ABC transporter permease [Clostridiales Family XIII bacterium]
MLFFENVKLALVAIKSNKMRSFLTMLGIIIGVSSVIAITTIGNGANSVVSKEFDAFGKNNANIYPNSSEEDTSGVPSQFTLSDINALKERFGDELRYVALYMNGSSEIKIGRMTGQFNISGIADNYMRITGVDLLYGREFTTNDVENRRDYIMIPESAAKKFFGRDDVTGQALSININNKLREMTVIGVYRPRESIFSRLTSNTSYTVYVPYTLWEDRPASVLDIYINEGYDVQKVLDKIKSYLALIHKLAPGYYVSNSVESQQATMSQILGILSASIGAIAAISLLVGGIGIMNIMLVSVTERTREIGIRKSLGAKTGDILVQFLIEAMLVSALGGFLGAALGIGAASVGLSMAKVKVSIDPTVVLLAVGFSALVGMFFGLYPARKAAKLDPIEALRYE